MKSLFRLFLQALILLTVMLVAALVTMRLAIHGREVAVPKVVGMTLREAEKAATDQGLLVDVENRFYSSEVPEGRIVSQLPAAGTLVRRGWRLRVAQSLGPQRAVIPDLIGESGRAAEMNARRRGLEVGATVVAHIPGPPDQVVAQSPPPNAVGVATPKINLLVTAGPEEQSYVMPDFVGHRLTEASAAIEQVGLRLGEVTDVAATGRDHSIILKQSPPAGQRVTPGTAVTFEISR